MKKSKRVHAKNSQPSFTLLEFLVVITAISIVSIIALPRHNIFDTFALKQEVANLHMACSYLQQKAMARNEKLYLIFDKANSAYRYPSINSKEKIYHLAPKVMLGLLPKTKGPPSSPKNIVISPVTFPQNKITFHPTGKISPGTAYFVTKKRSAMMALTVPISQVSFIREYRYENNRWKQA